MCFLLEKHISNCFPGQTLVRRIENKPNMRKSAESRNMIALHKGSVYKVPKKDLMTIYSPHPAIYTFRLAELVFGKENLVSISKDQYDTQINLLDQDKLESFISKLAKDNVSFKNIK